jgi:mono/diheme cytochrome c family protein
LTALAGVTAPAADAKKVTYEDDVLPIFRDNCLKCHNPDKLKGDLDLTSFSAVVKGGGSGATLNSGDPDGSLLFKSITHAEEPEMPPKAKLSDKEIATIRQWIAGGMLQGANSKALAANKPTVDLALKAGAIGKPDGPPPMPGPLSLEPFVRATRGSALAALAASPWAPVVALAGPHQISLYHTGDLEFLGVLPFPEGLPCDVKFSRNGKLLLAGGGRGGHSGLVAVWDLAKAERVITIGDQFDSVLAADISSDQQWIALGGPDRILKIYQTKDGALAHRLKKHTEWVTAVEFSPDSKYLATGDRNGGLVLWEAASGQEMFNLPGHRGAITAITWRSDSELVASSSEDGTLKLWKASDGSALRSINANPGGSLSARFTHDGRIVTCGRDNKVQIWDVSGKNLLNLRVHRRSPQPRHVHRRRQESHRQRLAGQNHRLGCEDRQARRRIGKLPAPGRRTCSAGRPESGRPENRSWPKPPPRRRKLRPTPRLRRPPTPARRLLSPKLKNGSLPPNRRRSKLPKHWHKRHRPPTQSNASPPRPQKSPNSDSGPPRCKKSSPSLRNK